MAYPLCKEYKIESYFLPIDKWFHGDHNYQMQIAIQLKLLATKEQKSILLSMMASFNSAASYVAKCAFKRKIFTRTSIHRLCYYDVRQKYQLKAQAAVRAIGKVIDCFGMSKDVCPKFKPYSAVILDGRNFRFKGIDKVSITTHLGRIVIPIAFGAHQAQMFWSICGEVDLVYRRDSREFFLLATADASEQCQIQTSEALGVDLGIVNIAADSDGNIYAGNRVEKCRQRHTALRRGLQKSGTRSAKRHLVKARRDESNFRKNENHIISKKLVELAKGTGRAIALEDLKGIIERTTVRADQRATHHGWSFNQLRRLIEYKAKLAGIPVVIVDARNTSRTCPKCRHCEKKNRKSQAEFLCCHCGYSNNADFVGALNIARAAVNRPFVSTSKVLVSYKS